MPRIKRDYLTWFAFAMAVAIILYAVSVAPARAQETPAEFFRADQARSAPVAPGRRASTVSERRRAAGKHRGVNPKLLALASRFNLTIISGYRPGARTPRGRPSMHASGQAIDARGRNIGAAIRYARSHGFGVGTYARCSGHSHVHFSTRPSEQYHVGCRRKFKAKRVKRQLRRR
jgi:hypothetical protein